MSWPHLLRRFLVAVLRFEAISSSGIDSEVVSECAVLDSPPSSMRTLMRVHLAGGEFAGDPEGAASWLGGLMSR